MWCRGGDENSGFSLILVRCLSWTRKIWRVLSEQRGNCCQSSLPTCTLFFSFTLLVHFLFSLVFIFHYLPSSNLILVVILEEHEIIKLAASGLRGKSTGNSNFGDSYFRALQAVENLGSLLMNQIILMKKIRHSLKADFQYEHRSLLSFDYKWKINKM